MNYNDKDHKNIENDELNIKSHLNASLDLSGISVSEDLINRTLEAIKKQTSERQDNKKDSKDSGDVNKKVIPWNRYIRSLAGVAAAALIIVAGYSLLNSAGNKKSDMNSLTAQDRSMADTAAEDPVQEFAADSALTEAPADNGAVAKGTKEAAGAAKTEGVVGEAQTEGVVGAASAESPEGSIDITKVAPSLTQQFTVTMDSDMSTQGEGTDGSQGIAASDENTLQQEGSLKSSEATASVTFRDIFPADPAQVQSLMITDEENGTSVTLTNQEGILDFYTLMDKYQFTYDTEATSANAYTVEVTAPQLNGAVYTMIVGSNITVSFSDKDVASQSIYSVADNALLLQELADFFKKYY